uniref:C3HC-type domain-containing protein n=3 Tax=Wuchereria bancrofti TaxID=6293 RepID=A0AAF5PGV7_WUCBA
MNMKEEDELTRLKRNASKLLQQAHEKTHAQQHRPLTNGRCRSACDQLDACIRRRLNSFTAMRWAGKPRKLSPLLFASHGWVCVSPDVVQCEACGQYMSVVVPSLLHVDVTVYQKSVRMLVSMITMKHYVTCPYRYTSFGTDDAIPLNALCKDVVNHRCEIMKKLNLEQIKVDVPEIPSTMVPETTVQKCKALICFGWQKSKYLDDTVVCKYCNRIVGLWLLRGHSFDVEKQHHKWCIFASDTSRHTDGWQCRHFVLQCINSSKDLPITNWAAKAEVWKSALMPRNIPSLIREKSA